MTRNIFDIAKADLLLAAANKRISELTIKMTEYGTFVATNPSFLSSCDDMFHTNAQLRIAQFIGNYANYLANNPTIETPREITLKELQAQIWDNFRFTTARPRSTSATHNFMEQSLLDAVITETQGSAYLVSGLFRDAQREDEEYRAAWAMRNEEDRAYSALYEQALEDNKAFDRRARRTRRIK